MKKLSVVLAAAAVLALVSTAFAYGRPYFLGGGRVAAPVIAHLGKLSMPDAVTPAGAREPVRTLEAVRSARENGHPGKAA